MAVMSPALIDVCVAASAVSDTLREISLAV